MSSKVVNQQTRAVATNLTPAKRIYIQHSNCYDIEDCSSFLEQLRAYQLADILGKYKLF